MLRMPGSYVKDAVRYLGEYEQLRDDINKLASAHVLTMDLNEDETFSYCGPKFLPGGKLAIVFRADRLGVNISDAFYRENLEKAISLVPTEEALGFYARKNISDEWEPQVESLQSQLKGILNRDITIVPNFEDVYNKLKSTKESSDFEQNIGLFVQLYFKALINELKSQKFDSDDMLQEALNEALDKGEVHFRVVDRIKGDCGEVAIGGGILYLQVNYPTMVFLHLVRVLLTNSRPHLTGMGAILIKLPEILWISCKHGTVEGREDF
jgi:hypothetical protein